MIIGQPTHQTCQCRLLVAATSHHVSVTYGSVESRQHIPLQKIFTYKVLSELLTEIQGAKNSAKIMNISNRFYTIIPYNFNTKKPPLLDKKEVVKLKVQMDKWLEIEVSYSLLKDKAEEGSSKDPNETSTLIESSTRQTWRRSSGCG